MKNSVVIRLTKYVKRARQDMNIIKNLSGKYGREFIKGLMDDGVQMNALRKLRIHGDSFMDELLRYRPSKRNKQILKELEEANRKWVELGIFW